MQGKLLPGIEKGNTSFGIIGKSFGESVTVLEIYAYKPHDLRKLISQLKKYKIDKKLKLGASNERNITRLLNK